MLSDILSCASRAIFFFYPHFGIVYDLLERLSIAFTANDVSRLLSSLLSLASIFLRISRIDGKSLKIEFVFYITLLRINVFKEN